MATLTRASNELFRRKPDEQFPTVSALFRHCQEQKEKAVEKWHSPSDVRPVLHHQRPMLSLGEAGNHNLNNWSFLQLCQITGVAKDTVNKVSAKTGVDIFLDTLPRGSKPMQFLTEGNNLRSIHGAAYTRLFNADLLGLVNEFAVDFQPPQEAVGGGNGFYVGEQDIFVFLVDPLGWCEINGEEFAPGFSFGTARSANVPLVSRHSGSRRFARTTSCGTPWKSWSSLGSTPLTSTRA